MADLFPGRPFKAIPSADARARMAPNVRRSLTAITREAIPLPA